MRNSKTFAEDGAHPTASQQAALLAGVEGLRCPVEPDWAHSGWQSDCVRLPLGDEQQAVASALRRARDR